MIRARPYSSAREYIKSVASSSLWRVSFSNGAEGQRTENMIGVLVGDLLIVPWNGAAEPPLPESDRGVQVLCPVAETGIARLIEDPIIEKGGSGNVTTGGTGSRLESMATQGTAGLGCPVGCQVEQSTGTVRTQDGRTGDHPLSDQGGRNETDGDGLEHGDHGISGVGRDLSPA